MKIAVCGAGSNFGYAYLKRLFALKNQYDLEIIGIDINPPQQISSKLFCDKVTSVGRHTSKGFDEYLFEVLSREKVDYVFPLQNGELRALNKNFRFKSPQFDIDDMLFTDKSALGNYLSDRSILTPIIKDEDIARSKGEIFVKPKNGGGSLGVKLWDGIPFDQSKMYLERFIDGTEYTVDSYYEKLTERSFTVARERLEIKAGVSTKCRLHVDERFIELSKKIARAIGQDGCICFQVIDDGKDLYVIDVNLRCGGGTEMSRFSGFDFYQASIFALLGEKPHIPKTTQNLGSYVTRQYHEILSR